ncbi:MAG: hypothetical protein IH946_06040 [Bacteroidetes bacterium]|nr:hypothetical protein [Bacteroidota bacterium]
MIAPATFFEKIAYRLSLLYVRLFAPGNYYDRGVFWKRQLLIKASALIKAHDIKNVIVSGASFHLTHHCLTIKQFFPEVNLIVDLRDPWTNNPGFLGFGGLSSKRQDYERKLENEVMNGADVVTSVAEPMTEHFKAMADKNPNGKFITILNGFDDDDIRMSTGLQHPPKDRIRFVLTGTLYNNVQSAFQILTKGLAELRENNMELFERLEFHFYGEAPPYYREAADLNYLDNITFFERIPLYKVPEKIASAHLGMLFLNENLEFSFSTKFYDYIAQKKKIAVFSGKGNTAAFIEENNIGFAFHEDNGLENFKRIEADLKAGELDSSSFDLKPYTIKYLADELAELLK